MRFAGNKDKACRDCMTLSSVTNRLRGSKNKSLRSSTLIALNYLYKSELQKLKKNPLSLLCICQVKYKYSYWN